MSADGVPPWARPVLEKVLTVSHMMARTEEYTPDLMRDAWESLHMAVRAALALDADGAGLRAMLATLFAEASQ